MQSPRRRLPEGGSSDGVQGDSPCLAVQCWSAPLTSQARREFSSYPSLHTLTHVSCLLYPCTDFPCRTLQSLTIVSMKVTDMFSKFPTRCLRAGLACYDLLICCYPGQLAGITVKQEYTHTCRCQKGPVSRDRTKTSRLGFLCWIT